MLLRFDDLDSTFGFVADLHRRLDQALGQLAADGAQAGPGGWASLTDAEDHLRLRADLPGVRDADLELSLHEDVLTLSARRAVAVPEGFEKAHAQERRAFQVTRSFALPCRVDPERVSARLEHGVLTVKLHKAEAAQPRQITVTRA